MRKTYCIVSYNMEDTTAADDASYSSDTLIYFGDVSGMSSQTSQTDYAYVGLNQYVLDGSKSELPTAASADEEIISTDDVAYWSTERSGANCEFDEDNSLTISFESVHTSCGVTLFFAEEYPRGIKLTWYGSSGSVLDTASFEVDALEYYCKNQVKNYAAIKIAFLSTWYPDRYVRLQWVRFGTILNWEDTDIKSASLTEETDESGQSVPINKVSVTIHDGDNDFDVVNASGQWNSAEYDQQLTVEEYVDGEIVPCGTFYLDGWTFTSNLATFSAQDPIGYIDRRTWPGEIFEGATVADIVASIMEYGEWTDYEIDEELQDIELSGYLASMTCRLALLEVCKAIGAVADCSRTDTITIARPNRTITSYIGTGRKFYGTASAELEDYVYAVEYTLTQYALSEDLSDFYTGALPAGTNTVSFGSPVLASSVTCTGGTMTAVSTSGATIVMDAAGEVTLTGYTYVGTAITLRREVPEIDAGTSPTVQSLTCSLYSMDVIGDVMDLLLSYWQLRKTFKAKIILEDELAGNWAGIMDRSGTISAAKIEKMSVDLTGGYLATIECAGYDTVVTDYHYAGDELYANGDYLL